jgi:hypothetical protein
MTKETRYLFQMSDVRGIEFTCRKEGCKTRTTLDPSKPLGTRFERWNCPNCGEPWADRESPLEKSFEKLFSAVKVIAEHQKSARVDVRLEIEGVESKHDAK